MTRAQVFYYSAILTLFGAGWGFTMPLSKIAVSDGYQHFGLIFWQLVIGAALMALLCAVRRLRLPMQAPHLRLYLLIAMIGTVIPNSASYQSAVHLPAGIMSILLSTIPMIAFPMALAFGNDRFEMRRLIGMSIGFVGVLMIVAPGANLPGVGSTFWMLIVIVTCTCYAFEGNYVAKWGTAGLHPLQVMLGASIIGALIALPLALGSGQWIDPRGPWGAPDYALIASSAMHVLVYAGYVWIVGQTGAVFAAQISYLVTLFGLLWARLILNEAYPPLVWVALGILLLGMYLVQPRRQTPIAEPG